MIDIQIYNQIRNGKTGIYKQDRGLLEISGTEAVQFLNGLITNDVPKLEDGEQMLAAFPTLKGRVFAVVRVMRRGDSFLFETEAITKQKVYDNLFRFTFAGDFELKDLSEDYEFYSFFGDLPSGAQIDDGIIQFQTDYFVPNESADAFQKLVAETFEISDELYEVLRIEDGTPKYGIDMDEETVVPEVNFDRMISYQKGCYIGQEVIARIHFRGKPAKQLRGLIFDDETPELRFGDEIKSVDGKNAGQVKSIAFSPKLAKTIALAYVRRAYLEEEMDLKVGGLTAKVSTLPFLPLSDTLGG